MIDHLPFRLLAAAAVDETLAPAEAADLDRHLKACAACRRELVGMRHDHQALGDLSPVPTAPWVRESVLEAARGRRGAARWMLLAAAVLLIALAIGAGLVAGALLQEYRSLIPVEPVELSSTWTPVAVAVPEDGSRIRAIVSSDNGFIAGGASADGATIWVSPDGLRWDDQSDLPAGDGAEVATMVIEDGRIIAGGRAPEGAVIWTSASGGSWERSVLSGGAGGGVNAIIATNDGWIAVGWRSDGAARSAAAWRSPDGRTWIAATVQVGPELRAVAPVPDGGFIAISAGGPETVPFFSVDGTDWSIGLLSLDLVVSLPGEAATVARFGDHVYALGTSSSGSFAVWRSDDGRAWSDVDVPAILAVDIHAARVVDGRLLIVGSTASGPLSLAMTGDATFDFQAIEAPSGDLDAPASFYDAAGLAGRMVAVGVQGADAAVWASE